MKDGGYKRLFDRCTAWAARVRNPRTKVLWHVPTARLGDAWSLQITREQVHVADVTGWDVRLVCTPEGLEAHMVERPPAPPV